MKRRSRLIGNYAAQFAPDHRITRYIDDLDRCPPRMVVEVLQVVHLLARVFLVDVLERASCGGPLRILVAIHSPEAIRAILECLCLLLRAPPTATANLDHKADGIEQVDFDQNHK